MSEQLKTLIEEIRNWQAMRPDNDLSPDKRHITIHGHDPLPSYILLTDEIERLERERAKLQAKIERALAIESQDNDTGHRYQDDEATGWNDARDAFREILGGDN